MHAAVPATSQGLYEMLVATSHEIHAWGLIDGTDRPLGAAAATVAWFAPAQKLVIFHCGDTMAWHFDGTRVERLTREHVTGRGITHYFGQTDRFRLDVEASSFEPGDLLCMVTDGVTESMSDADVQQVLQECSDPEVAARELVHRARGKGSRDGITALVVELEEW
jgi:serine/threonine protein phosphatase PrpC